ncbi:MAG: pseudomurein-binding repeat-containing protein, partial [Methanobacteriaceae archaeon]
YEGSNIDINVKYGIKNPTSPNGVSISKSFTKSEYYSISKKITAYIENNNQCPNYVSSTYGNIQYQTAIYGLAKIGDYINKNKVLPSTLSLNIPISHSMNNYLPVFKPNNNNNNVTTILLGSNSLGTVELVGAFGNINSGIKIAVIIGVYPLEASIEQLLYNSIIEENSGDDFYFYFYKINVTKSASSFDEEKMYGQSLADEFAYPHILSNNYNDTINVPEEN